MKIRLSINGFYCADCKRWTYQGYDSRDKENLPNSDAVCIKCGEKYLDKEGGKNVFRASRERV